ncbi:malic enzyme-like NAD(P)-binding protein [Holospora curviuscula]|uniref:NADP-dependent malic enzyme n=1 Tax=Holospora curviuscula TaxID=1082868 RepID=A0A2S5R9Q8_9PROT|nr:malic enzyme-like NAD(P)-binding protein [Holospora curviuscula]PPE03865.1 NADP-dependent malic enzyme [Holospora curviuscula]
MVFETPSLRYHAYPKAGKWEMLPSKPLEGWEDLALAYNPGVAFACEAIVSCQHNAYDLTNKGHLVAVITNGTAVLGMGDIGPLAAKPVMEGKSVLIKYFSGLDSIDLELAESDPYKLIEHIVALAPSFGAINLEDIKAPECFIVEQALIERLTIPVFHDDQHGTAIVVCAAILNGLHLKQLPIEEAVVVVNGAGAGALASLELLRKFGLKQENIWLCDQKGLVHTERAHVTPHKAPYAQKSLKRTLGQVLEGADVFLGLSRGRLLTGDMISPMNPRPLIFALANPVPEILPEEVYAVHPDALVGTGRSDYPNQINNILCFPYMFKGALAVQASCIVEEMKRACVEELKTIAQEGEWGACGAYKGALHPFGPDYFIPKAFDPRLRARLPLVIAEAAIKAGVARKGVDHLRDLKVQLVSQAYEAYPTFGRLCVAQSIGNLPLLAPPLIFSYALEAKDQWNVFKSALLALERHNFCTAHVIHPEGSPHSLESCFSGTPLLSKALRIHACNLPTSDKKMMLRNEVKNGHNSVFLLGQRDEHTEDSVVRIMKGVSTLYQTVYSIKEKNPLTISWLAPSTLTLPRSVYIQGDTVYIQTYISIRDFLEVSALVTGCAYEHGF